MGRTAKAALIEGRNNADPEIQSRCTQLLPQALALDLKFRVDRYLKDTEGKLDHDLPLWKTYRDKIGADANAKKLFSEMLQVNGALLEAVEEEPTKVTDLVQRRYQEMYQEMYGNPLGGGFKGGYQPGTLNASELCCVLFAASQPAYKPSQPDWILANLYTQPNFTTPLTHAKDGTAYRKVFFGFVEARADDNVLNQCAWMFCQHQIKEGADVMAKALKDGKTTQVYTKASVICCVGTIGTKDHVKSIEPLLKDETQVQQFFVGGAQRGVIQIRDVALAITIHLNGKNPKDYGYRMWNVYQKQLIQYHQIGFSTDEERTAAFKKWADENKPAEPKKK